MLKDIYLIFGGVGTFVVAILMCMTMVSWLLSLTRIMVRDLTTPIKTVLVLFVSLFPQVSLLVLYVFQRKDRKTSKNQTVSHLQETDSVNQEALPALETKIVPSPAAA